MVPRNQLAMTSSAPFLGCLAELTPGTHPSHHHPCGVEQAQGQCLASCWLPPLQLLLAMGFLWGRTGCFCGIAFCK